MRKAYTAELRDRIIMRYAEGETITSIHKTTGISRSTLYIWINEHNATNGKTKLLNLGNYNKLKSHCEKLENIIKILKTCGCPIDAPLIRKYEVIKELSSTYSIKTLCAALDVPTGSYYNHILRNKNENSAAAQRKRLLTPVIEEIFNASKQTFGAGKITAVMNDRGYKTTERTVAKIMHENGWFSIKSGAKTIYLQTQERHANILNQQFNPKSPNEVWVSDVTYFRCNNKLFYICVILDLYARKVISFTISKRNSTWLTKTTLANAYNARKPEKNTLIFHSDRGSNYTSDAFRIYIASLGIQHSFSRKAMPYDNSVCESFFGNLKREELYRTKYTSERHFRVSISEYMEFYNSRRPHTILRYRTPDKAEAEYYDKSRKSKEQ